MNEILLNEIEPLNYESVDNLCLICLEPNNSTPILSENNSGYNSDDNSFVDVELTDNSRKNNPRLQELWSCDECNKSFHLNCIIEWKKNKIKFTCPNCRKEHMLSVDEDDIINNYKPLIYYDIKNIFSFAGFAIIGCGIFGLIIFFSVYNKSLFNNKFDKRNETSLLY